MKRVKLWIVLTLSFTTLFYPVISPLKAAEKNSVLKSYLSITNLVDSKQCYQYLQKLCSEEFEGRQTGTRGGARSAEWIGNMFKGFGLKPFDNDNNQYWQTYKAPCFNLLPEIAFRITTKKGDTSFQYKKDFVAAPYSGTGKVSGAIVFVGYGITSEDIGYDDYAGVDVKNKIVMMLRKKPESVGLSEEDSYFATKTMNAKNHGAIGIIIVEKDKEENPFPLRSKSATGSISDASPSVFVPTSVADQILIESGTSIARLQEDIENTMKPKSIPVKAGAFIEINMSYEMKDAQNVIGYIPAKDPLQEESVLVTAHYDHLGIDLVNGELYPGANDNASGTAALLETARVLTSCYYEPNVNIVFIAFSGEEEGLLGSAYYIENPLFPLDKIQAVLNMDMVGTGTGSIYAGTNFKILTDKIEESAEILDRKVPISKNLVYGGSDQFLFARKNIPAVFFIRSNPTGIGDYHVPEDTVDTVDPKNLLEQSQLIIMIVSAYAQPIFLVIDTSSDYWFSSTALHPRILIHGSGSKGVSGKIKDQSFTIPGEGLFTELLSLSEGQNLIQIQIFDENNGIVFERILSIKAQIIPELEADFNFDFTVDFLDFMIFAKVYPNDSLQTITEKLCDIDQNHKIDESDFNLFKKRYDYILEK